MKKPIIYIMALIILSAVSAWAGEIQPRVTAYGTAIIEVTPDEMFWSLNIENRGSVINTIASRHSSIVAEIIAFLDDMEVAENDVQTSMMQFGEKWVYKDGQRFKTGYYASSQITFKLTDFLQYQPLWEGLSERPGVSIHNIRYGYSKHIEIQNKATNDALLVAGKKALAMAETLKVGLGNPLLLEENPSLKTDFRSNALMANGASFKSASPETRGFALGKIKIQSRVKVVYGLVSE